MNYHTNNNSSSLLLSPLITTLAQGWRFETYTHFNTVSIKTPLKSHTVTPRLNGIQLYPGILEIDHNSC